MQPKIALMVEEWTLILVLYQCLVFPSCLVDGERDYLSLNKRYPKLSISPDFSKVVLIWTREMENLKLSFHTPVSFEHDLVEVDSYPEQMKASSQSVNEQYGTSKCGATVWNAKVILMSGIRRDALEELSFDKIYDDRIPHINNILRFAFLRENRAFMAIGGPQDVVEDASVDDSSLIKNALSYTKDLTQLDLQKCKNWNRFLEFTGFPAACLLPLPAACCRCCLPLLAAAACRLPPPAAVACPLLLSRRRLPAAAAACRCCMHAAVCRCYMPATVVVINNFVTNFEYY